MTQEGKPRASASIIFSKKHAEPNNDKAAPDQKTGVPIDRGVLNKINPDNVFIEKINEDTFRIIQGSVGSPLNRTLDQFHYPLYLLECFMQSRRYYNSRKMQSDRPKRFRDILRNISITLDRAVPRSSTLYIKQVDNSGDSVGSRLVSTASDLVLEGEVIGSFQITTARIE